MNTDSTNGLDGADSFEPYSYKPLRYGSSSAKPPKRPASTPRTVRNLPFGCIQHKATTTLSQLYVSSN